MSLIYPAGDEQVTPNIGLATWGMDEVLAENMILIDAAIGGPTDSIKINGSVVPATNFINSASVTFSVVGSNVSATATSAGSAAWSALTGTLSNGQVIPYADAGISRLGGDSLAIGNGIAGDTSGTLTLSVINTAAINILNANAPPTTGYFNTNVAQSSINPTWNVTAGAMTFQMYMQAVPNVLLGTLTNHDMLFMTNGTAIVALRGSGAYTLGVQTPLGWAATSPLGTAVEDTSISRLSAKLLAVGNGTFGDFSGSLKLTGINNVGTYTDSTGSVGTNGQVLNSTVTGTKWDGSTWGSLIGDLTETQVIPWDGGTPGTPDTGLSRIGAANVAVGNGTTGNASGTLTLGLLHAGTGTFFANAGVIDVEGANYQTTNGIQLSGSSNSTALTSDFASLILVNTNTTVNNYASIQWSDSSNPATQNSACSIYGIFTAHTGAAIRGKIAIAAHGTDGNLTRLTITPTVIDIATASILTWDGATPGTPDTGISRLAAGSLAIGTGAANSIAGNLSYNRVNVAGADYAGTATVTAGNTTVTVSYAANYTGAAAPIVVVTPTSDPLAAGVPVGYWVTAGGATTAWTGFVINIQTALAGNIIFNYVVIGKA